MPLNRCSITEDGKKKNGWRWGSSGVCYTGDGAKKKALKQGLAITYKTGEKFDPSPKKSKAEVDAEIDREVARLCPLEESKRDDLERNLMDRADQLTAGR